MTIKVSLFFKQRFIEKNKREEEKKKKKGEKKGKEKMSQLETSIMKENLFS